MENKLKRYFWLVDTLRGRKMSLKDLSNKWERSSLNDDGTPLSRRTFQEHKNTINELGLGVEIIYDYATRTYLLQTDKENENAVARWMWSAMSLQEAMRHNSTIRGRIITDEIPSAQTFLDPLLLALNENRVVRFAYHPFGSDAFEVVLQPYFVQMTGQRWYLFGCRNEEKTVKAYALDRMEKLDLGNDTFIMSEDFSADEYLKHSGIGQYENIPETEVKIRAYGRQVDLLRTLPLHPSQRETKTEDGKSEFSYFLRPTSKFYGDLLSCGKYVKVLSPGYVKNHIKGIINKLSEYYQ